MMIKQMFVNNTKKFDQFNSLSVRYCISSLLVISTPYGTFEFVWKQIRIVWSS